MKGKDDPKPDQKKGKDDPKKGDPTPDMSGGPAIKGNL